MRCHSKVSSLDSRVLNKKPFSTFFTDEPLHHVIIEAIKGGTPVPKTDPPPDTPRDFVRLMKDCYSFAPGMRPVFSGKS